MDIHPTLFGTLVAVTWQDTTGYINVDPEDVVLSECRSLGVLVSADNEKLVLRSALYTGCETGDYTAIAVGCIDKVESAN